MTIYMEYEGIKGSVNAEGYEGMIELDTAYFGVNRKISMKPGTMSNRESGIPNFSVLHTRRRVDSSTTEIMKQVFSGSAGKQVIFHYVRTDGNQLIEYLTYTFEDCIPTFYRVVAVGTSMKKPIERLYLSYSSILVSTTPSGSNNKAQSPLRYGYDLEKAKSL